jgi:enoyl-CoA hydratase/carnithine racemase
LSLVTIESKEDLAIVRLQNGVTNAISPEVAVELSRIIAQVKKDKVGMVLAGGEKFFSMGFDLPKLLLLDRSGMTEFFYLFNQVVFDILTLPVPTVAAIKAHAIAGGTILLLACDHRVAASGKVLIGLNEIKLGVPVPYLSDLILRRIAGDVFASEMIYQGEFIDSSDAQKKGIVNSIFPKPNVEEKALEIAASLAKLPRKAFHASKSNRVEAIRSRYETDFRLKNETFLDCWFSPETRALLKEAAKKF